jgi:hypothetical protein
MANRLMDLTGAVFTHLAVIENCGADHKASAFGAVGARAAMSASQQRTSYAKAERNLAAAFAATAMLPPRKALQHEQRDHTPRPAGIAIRHAANRDATLGRPIPRSTSIQGPSRASRARSFGYGRGFAAATLFAVAS